MGAFCFTKDDEPEALGKPKDTIPAQASRGFSRLPKAVRTSQSKRVESRGRAKSRHDDIMTQHTSDDWSTVAALDAIIDRKVGGSRHPATRITDLADYQKRREELKRREVALSFENKLKSTAISKEEKVDKILQTWKKHDEDNLFAPEPTREGWGGQRHRRLAGDHFLSNKDLIDRSRVFWMARKLPKGAHLHIHFNACLQPHVLLNIASKMEQMYMTSDLPLLAADGYRNYKRAKIQFSIMTLPASTGNLFDPNYRDRNGAMKFKDFLREFPEHYHPHQVESQRKKDGLEWLQEKLIFREEEAHGPLQTVAGAWEEFNMRTQMMKGLFNYETAYREYTRKCLEDFMADNIQYAEIRPNFMDTNQVWTDDGTRKINNVGIMEMIIEEYQEFQKNGGRFGGMKVIYCCPRSWPRDKVATGLKECLEFKKKWPRWIAGFDLVGEEGAGHVLKTFVPEFLRFQEECREAGVEIPFLFHCGETLNSGSETDDNLLDALLLGAKRIGHAFSLARHPYLMERMKQAGVCLELCPISNEVLGLTPRVNGHAMYSLLANNVHCTVNSDNGTLFK